MGKARRKPRPAAPKWFWLEQDGCWFCKNRNNCNQCKVLKRQRARERKKKNFKIMKGVEESLFY